MEPGLEIGLDVGGTWVKAWVVAGAPGERRALAGAERAWGGFEALPLDEQRAGAAQDETERAATRRIVEAGAELVAEALDGAPLARLGVATAGPKTADGRGIALWRRGPRAPRLMDQLLAALAARGVRPDEEPARLVDDSVAALRGEVLAAGGSLAGVRSALFLGPGTDLAEAWLLDGTAGPRPAGLPAPWELADPGRGQGHGAGATFGDTIRLGPDADLPDTFEALGRLARARLAAARAADLPRPERLVVGARGGQLLADSDPLRKALEAGLAGALPAVASTLRAAPAIGALG